MIRLLKLVAILYLSSLTFFAAAQSSNEGLSLLLEQNRQLQLEVQALRGQLEEQGFEIKKLQRDSLGRYTDTDNRLIDLEALVSERKLESKVVERTPDIKQDENPEPAVQIENASSISSRSKNSNRRTLQPAVLTEQQLYQLAYDSVINSDFQRSVAEFNHYLDVYPIGRFVTNAHYWKGQAFLYMGSFDAARDSYEIILNEHRESSKLPDAMYGLGLAYQGLGNIPRAKQLLNEIKREFPNTGVANLADTRLLSID
jgi:tol-pal system protein YbgF